MFFHILVLGLAFLVVRLARSYLDTDTCRGLGLKNPTTMTRISCRLVLNLAKLGILPWCIIVECEASPGCISARKRPGWRRPGGGGLS